MACTGSRRIIAMFLHADSASSAPHFCTVEAPSPRKVWTLLSVACALAGSGTPDAQNTFSTVATMLSRIFRE